MPTRRDLLGLLGRGRAVATLAGLAAVLAVWAASVPRPARVIAGPPPSRPVVVRGYNDPPPLGTSQIDAPPFTGPRREGSVLDAVIGWGALVLVVAGVVAVVVVLVRYWLANRVTGGLVRDAATGPTLEGLAVAVSADASGRLVALSSGTPAEGIVAAWTRLEDSLRTAGLPLPESRTSSETTVAALARYGVDRAALVSLAALYREASWSRHPLTEEDRDRAAAAFRDLDAQLGAARGSRSRRD